jgi:hypothetical protein
MELRVATPEPAHDGEEVARVEPLPGMNTGEFRKLAQSVLVVIPHCGSEGISPGLAMTIGAWARLDMRVGDVRDPSGGFLEVTRSAIVKMFLDLASDRPQLRYLVMIDNDQEVQWDAPLRLVRHGLPIVSGLVCSWSQERGIFACFTARDENGTPRFPSWQETQYLPAEGLIEAAQVGTGLIAIRRDVLETMIEAGEIPFSMTEEARRRSFESGSLYKSEDISFSERAERYGFRRYVDLSVQAVHWKHIPITWPLTHVRTDLKSVDWRPSKFDHIGVI